MSKPLARPLVVHQFFKDDEGDIFCVHAVFDLPTIIEAGYAPDDVIDYVVCQCAELHKTKDWLKDMPDMPDGDAELN